MEAKQGDKKASRTLAEVLNTGRDVFERARALLPTLPEGTRGAAPATLADAMQLIQERQQSQQATKDPKSKSKTASAQQNEQAVPGARVGGAVQNSAYWTLVEVSIRSPAMICIVVLGHVMHVCGSRGCYSGTSRVFQSVSHGCALQLHCCVMQPTSIHCHAARWQR